MDKVLLVGGAGLIGSQLAKTFLNHGDDIYIMDRFIQFTSPFKNEYNKILQQRLGDILDQIEIIRGDARYYDDVENTVSRIQPDIIIHLANMPISKLSNIHLDEAIDSTVTTTINLLKASRKIDNIKRFVYISSSMVYGDFNYIPADEEHPKNPIGIYGTAKLAGETLTIGMARHFSIDYSIVRPSAVYGPSDINERVSQIFIDKSSKGEKIKVKGGDSTKLDFTYVDDVAEGIFLVSTKTGGANEVFNITKGEGRSLIDFVNILKKYWPELEFSVEDHDDEVSMRGTLSIEKAKKLIGFDPKITLEMGIEKYVEYKKRFDI